jgi:hypothetical protein
MFASYTSRFRDLQSKAGTPLADFVNSLLGSHGPLPFGCGRLLGQLLGRNQLEMLKNSLLSGRNEVQFQ